jgi:hypothetical protein
VTAVPYADALLVPSVLSDAVAIPLRDADPAVVSLVWDEDNAHPLVAALVAVAEELPASRPRGDPSEETSA